MVGTMLLLAITVAMFSALGVAVMQELDRTPPPSDVDFRVDESDGRTTVVSVWGESLKVEDVRLLYHLNGVRQNRNLADPPLSTNLTHRSGGLPSQWDLGESLRLGCPIAETCAHPGGLVSNISIIQRSIESVVFSTEEGVGQGSIVQPISDLMVAVEEVKDPARPITDPLYDGGTFYVRARVSNSGLEDIGPGTTLTLRYYLDGSGTHFYETTRTGGLVAGASFTGQNPALALATGSHTVRVEATASPALLEATSANNQVVQGLNVVAGVFDPNQPYEDGNDDVLYNPYSAGDVLLAISAVTDGSHTTAANKGLVIPSSVPPISVGTGMNFASARKMNIATPLTTTGSNNMVLTAGWEFNLTGAIELRSGRDLTITSTSRQVDLSQDRLDTNGRDITVNAATRILAPSATIGISGLGSDPDEVFLTTSAGRGDYNNAAIRAANDVTLTSRSYLVVMGANIRSASGAINFDVTSPYTPPPFPPAEPAVRVQGVSIIEPNDPNGGSSFDNCADVLDSVPSAAYIVGTPTSGRVERDC